MPPTPDARDSVRTRMSVGMGTAAEASSRGGYAVQVASASNAADAYKVFRTLQTKFPKQLGKREPIVRPTDLGAKGTSYRAMVGPFASMEDATRMCSTLKAAGGNCLVQRN
jgi:cell division septation protein DedD